MKKNAWIYFLVLGLLAASIGNAGSLQASAVFYQHRYPLKSVNEKLVDNKGNGDERVYGVRNFRTVLNGIVYRGGANNDFNKFGARKTQNPLPEVGLNNLCKEGFETAIYLYTKNYDSSPKSVSCVDIYGQNHTLKYLQLSPHLSNENAKEIIKIIHERLQREDNKRPIYLHCWNGWHASGLISAMTLRQFCDYSVEAAVKYWDQNTDGVNKDPRYEDFRNILRSFKPDPSLKIDPAVKAAVCPQVK